MWILTFGQKGSSDHYRIEVSQSGISDPIFEYGNDYLDTETPLNGRSSIGDVVTLSRGIRLMRNETDIHSRCFVDSAPNWNLFNFNISEGASSISLDPISMLGGSGHAGYVYLLVSKNDEYRAALDATNGQVLFSWTHTETFNGAI